ncbi:MAG TPA: iron ABC transporter permease [Azospirillaceae bacterium]|nr:iron ABC transporter permease [Azospirillaceae bacterium]
MFFFKERAIQYSTGLFVAMLVTAPLVPVVYQSFLSTPIYDAVDHITLSNYMRFLAHPVFHEALVNSVVLACIATVIATCLGVGIAVLVARTNMPLRGLIASSMLVPMYVPQLVLAFGWLVLYGPAGYVTLEFRQLFGFIPWNFYTVAGMSVLAGMASTPMVYLLCIGSLRLLDSSLEGAARSVGARPWTVIRHVIVPMIRPAIVYSAMLNFIASLELLSIPLIFGAPARLMFFTTFLYVEGGKNTVPDYGLVGSAAVFLLVLITLLLFVQGLLLRKLARFTSVRGKASRSLTFDLGRWKYAATAAVLFFFVFSIGLPILGLVVRSFVEFLTPLMAPWELTTLANYQMIFEQEAYVRSIRNSVVVAGFGGLLATVLVALVALVVHRSDFPFRRQLEFVAIYPRAVPGMIAGIGLFWAMLWIPFLTPLHGTIWILIIAFTMRNIPAAFGALSPMLLQIDRDLDRGARSVGADWWTTCRTIILPLAKNGLFAAYVLLFISFFKEYASAAFLFAHGSEIIGTTMLEFWGSGNTGAMAALGTIQLAITCVFVMGARKILGVKLYD